MKPVQSNAFRREAASEARQFLTPEGVTLNNRQFLTPEGVTSELVPNF